MTWEAVHDTLDRLAQFSSSTLSLILQRSVPVTATLRKRSTPQSLKLRYWICLARDAQAATGPRHIIATPRNHKPLGGSDALAHARTINPMILSDLSRETSDR